MAPPNFNGDDARHFLREIEHTRSLYSAATKLTGHLESCAGAQQIVLDAAEAEVTALRDQLSKADARVAGKIPP